MNITNPPFHYSAVKAAKTEAGLTKSGFWFDKKREMREPHGQPEIIGSIIGALVFVGGAVVLACATWAWAVGVNVIHGIIAGALIGVTSGAFFGYLVGIQTTRSRRREFGFAASGCILAPILLLTIVGAIVGVIIRASF